ncbi:MAG: hypothetical protein ACPGU1_06555 [Myxococcota bacterium]
MNNSHLHLLALFGGALLFLGCSDTADEATATSDDIATDSTGDTTTSSQGDVAVDDEQTPDATHSAVQDAEVPSDDGGPMPSDGDDGDDGDIASSPADDSRSVWDLGEVTLDPETGLSEVLTVDLPTDAVSLAISITGSPGVYYAVDELKAPSGAELVSSGWYMSPNNPGGHQLCIPCANRISASSGAHATLVPMAPSVDVEAGLYTFRIVAFDVVVGQIWDPPEFDFLGDTVQVKLIAKHASGGLPASGTLNLNLHFTGAAGLTAESAPSDARMLEALETFEAVYAQIGVGIGTITWRDIDDSYSFIDGIMGPEADFEAAAAQTDGAPPGVNFIFVDEIVDSSNPLGGFGVILGVSGGIPGPVGLQGTPRSAVIVDVSPPEMAGDIPFGITMAHEMGHFLGLYHSSEMPFVNMHDPLPDTGENDVSNLMFFEASNGGTTLTDNQGSVIRGNPWVMHTGEEAP